MQKLFMLLFILGIYCTNVLASETQSIHIVVALCDNIAQNIAPVPPKLGNGQNPKDNLYWGAYHGVKTTFVRSTEWSLVSTQTYPENNIMERIVFKHRSKNVYIVADAYDGNRIRNAVEDYIQYCAGTIGKSTYVNGKTINFGGDSDLVAYVGHNALIEKQLDAVPASVNKKPKDAITLGCYSKRYFKDHLPITGAYPLIWTTGAMAPEGYILDGAIKGWINKESRQSIRQRAVQAYSKFQKCPYSSADRLLLSGY